MLIISISSCRLNWCNFSVASQEKARSRSYSWSFKCGYESPLVCKYEYICVRSSLNHVKNVEWLNHLTSVNIIELLLINRKSKIGPCERWGYDLSFVFCTINMINHLLAVFNCYMIRNHVLNRFLHYYQWDFCLQCRNWHRK